MFGDITFSREFNGVGFNTDYYYYIFYGDTFIDLIRIGVGLSKPSSSFSNLLFMTSDYFVLRMMSFKFKFYKIIFFLLNPPLDLVSSYF